MSDRSRAWVFTINNYTDVDLASVVGAAAASRYCCCGKEVGEQGTPHLQGYLYMATPNRQSAIAKLLPRAHLAIARGTPQQNRVYCSKEDLYLETGEMPMSQVEKGAAEVARWDTIKAHAVAGNLDAIDSKTYIHHYKTLKAIATDHMVKPADLDAPCGIWMCGEAGTGKTTYARTTYPDSYIKSRNVWWDGYQNERTVILDDLDKYNVALAADLKDWSDKWTFKAQIKGGYLWIRPNVFVVTSQYTIDDIWTDEETRAALHRRFQEMPFYKLTS